MGLELAPLKPEKSQANQEKLVTLQVRHDDVLNHRMTLSGRTRMNGLETEDFC